MNDNDSNATRPSSWRNPVMWLVVGLPLLSIVAGVGLVVVATRAGGDDTVNDAVRRVSQIQTTDLGPDEAARKLGLSAVLRVENGIVEVLPATGAFARGEALLAPALTRRLIERYLAAPAPGAASEPAPDLTPREREVWLLIARGLSNQEVGQRLFLSEATVKAHVTRLLAKLGVRDRVQAVVMAYENGLVRPAVD